MTTDLEIARAAQMEPVEAVAWKLGISAHELMPMGNGVAKVTSVSYTHLRAHET